MAKPANQPETKRKKTRTAAPTGKGFGVLGLLRGIRDFFTGFFALTLTTVIFFVILAVASYYTVGYFIRGEEVIAPDLSGRTVTEALELLRDRKLLVELEGSEPSEALEAGMILRQRPRAASRVKARTPIRVVISSGPRLTVLPATLLGLSQAEAGIELRRMGLTVGEISYVEIEGSAADEVVAFDPPVGTGLLPGSRVNLLVSTGSSGPQRLMPNLYGLTPEQATAEAERYGLKISFSNTGRDPTASPGTVQGQSLAPGIPVEPGQKVNLTLRALL